MKSLVWAIVILIAVIGILFECRYEIRVHSPVVAKLDRFTGDVWIANSGVWRKIEPAGTSETVQSAAPAVPSAEKSAEKAK